MMPDLFPTYTGTAVNVKSFRGVTNVKIRKNPGIKDVFGVVVGSQLNIFHCKFTVGTKSLGRAKSLGSTTSAANFWYLKWTQTHRFFST